MTQKRFRKLLMSYRDIDRNLARDITADVIDFRRHMEEGVVFHVDKEKCIFTQVCGISYKEALEKFKDAGLLCRG